MGRCCTPTIGGRPPSGSGNGGGSELGLLNYETEHDTSVFSTGSGVYVTTGKTLVTPALPAADYRIGVHYQCSCTILGEGQWRVRLDGASNVWPTDHNQDFGSDSAAFPAYRSRVIALGAGVHTFDLQTKQTGGETTTTRRTYFELWRVPPSPLGQKIDPCICTELVQTQAFNLTTTRVLAGRTFVTPVLPAGAYRIGLSFAWEHTAGSAFLYNMDLDGGGDIWATNFREIPSFTNDPWARILVTEVQLTAGSHTFDLSMSSSSTTSILLYPTTWTLQRVDGSP